MPHITVKVSEELFQHARLAAARRNMTVSALLRAFLTTIENEPAKGADDNQVFHRLFPPQREKSIEADFFRLMYQARGVRR
jgi:hypothetical protein